MAISRKVTGNSIGLTVVSRKLLFKQFLARQLTVKGFRPTVVQPTVDGWQLSAGLVTVNSYQQMAAEVEEINY